MLRQRQNLQPRSVSLSFATRLLLGVVLSVVSALLLTLSMPPHGIWPFAVLGLLPMMLAQNRVLPSRISGLAMAITIGGLVGLYIMDAFLALPGAPWYMRGLPVIFGLFILATDSGTRAFHERTHYRWFVLSGALGWVGVEMIRSLVPVLGTWGFIGYAYFRQPWLIQPVSVFGIYGLGLVTLLLSYGLGLCLLSAFDARWRLDADISVVAASRAARWLRGTGLAYAGWVLLSLALLTTGQVSRMVRVAAVQPGFRSLWTAEEDATNWLSPERYATLYRQLFDRLLAQSEEAGEKSPDLIVWPEGALAFDPQYSNTGVLRRLASDTGAYFVIPYGVDYRNEVTVLSPEETFLGVYGKSHPVVFVNEKSTTRGSFPTYDTALGTLGTIICYDLDFTDTARRVARNGARLIAVPSGDWPGIADKHYAHLVFRAVENRVAMVKVDRSYDSAIIDPYGRILDSAVSLDPVQRTLFADVPVLDALAPQRRLGDWVGWLSLAGMVFFMVLDPVSRRHSRKNA